MIKKLDQKAANQCPRKTLRATASLLCLWRPFQQAVGVQPHRGPQRISWVPLPQGAKLLVGDAPAGFLLPRQQARCLITAEPPKKPLETTREHCHWGVRTLPVLLVYRFNHGGKSPSKLAHAKTRRGITTMEAAFSTSEGGENPDPGENLDSNKFGVGGGNI